MTALLPRRGLAQILALIVILAVDRIVSPQFFDLRLQDGRLFGSLIDVLNRGTPVALLSLGMVLVIATRGIDLSVGAVMAISGAIAASLADTHSLAVVLAAALGAGLVCGLWNGFLVAVLGIQPIVATLILMVAGRGIAQLITEGRIVTFSSPDLVWLGNGAVLGVPMPVAIALGMLILTGAVVRGSALGLLIEATGGNARASELAGVGTRAMILAVYVWCGICAALAGVIAAADIMGADANNAGLWLELDAILAVVIGGTSLFGGRFSLVLAVLGALIIQTMNTGILLSGYPPEFNLLVKAVVVMTVLLLQSPKFSGIAGIASAAAEVQSMKGLPPVLITAIVLVAGFALCAVQFPNIASTRVVGNLLTDNAFLGIVATGMTFVIISGGIDLSVGSVIGFTTVFVALAIERWGVPPLLAFVAILALSAAFGAAMGAVIHVFDLPPFIVTLAGMFLARGASFLLSTESVPITAPVYSTVSDFALRMPGGGRLTAIAIIMLVIVIGGALLLQLTRFGANVYALGGSRATASLMGVAVGKMTVRIYMLSSLLAGIAGIVFSFYTSAGYSLSAVGVELDTIAAVVIGGTLLTGGQGSVIGTFLGVLIQGLIQTYINFDGTLSSWWTKIATGVLLFAFIALQQGLVALARRPAAKRAGAAT
ncbi:ribose/xylose/arabinose/galactoside ABC-type transport system permease subunit [Bradyrhizobium japonicum]|nr:ribose/xylose/arabinose/galactoside ABC-type transport system permease subunit [Bradyrhizobium japonicum]MCP1777979.1 ribose/xylose/arabinose/galactoside ABC-type transport system permease subunit [Bradyrhizobium japonicum]MCP1857471.1 ribose/xylose/arabinose/galactoside ABC-type transport system permease subunit [Bradyrhizobium japonicum]MCP1888285.1 ribose/xylose/arabinose/galactoside ABC-type transport system permease subunit [Bradyrhizobium japonicum]MCP1959023.1 ribose/xylose/arabinose/